MASNKLYKPGQLITVVCKESIILCRVTKRDHLLFKCRDCKMTNGRYVFFELCGNINCFRLSSHCYPKVIKRWKKQT